VPNDIIWRRIQHRFPKEKHNIAQICIRSGVILIMGAVAAAVPDLEPFIALVGAVFFSTLGKLDMIFEFFFFFIFNILFFFVHRTTRAVRR
jgi:hypothetical protein